MSGPRVLLIGYSGANNTGAEALLQADIEDIRAIFGEEAMLTVPALKGPDEPPALPPRGAHASHRADAVDLPLGDAAPGP